MSVRGRPPEGRRLFAAFCLTHRPAAAIVPPVPDVLSGCGEVSESAEGARLLSEYTGLNLYRGFKSLPLRHQDSKAGRLRNVTSRLFSCLKNDFHGNRDLKRTPSFSQRRVRRQDSSYSSLSTRVHGRATAFCRQYGLIHGLEDLPLNARGKRFGFNVAGVVEKVQTHLFRVRHK